MSTVPPPTTTPAPASSPVYRWLMVILGLMIFALALYRATESGTEGPPPSRFNMKLPIPPFNLTERSGRLITNHDLAGKIWIADFVYTTCPGPCPLVTADMARLQTATMNDPHVQLVTFTVDPQTDTPMVLAKYADTFHADANKWWFLTGPEKPLYALIQNGFLQSVQDNRGQPAEPGQFTVTHSIYFALVDANGDMRGVYQSRDADERQKLLRDIRVLEQEEGPVIDLPVNEARTPPSVVAAIIGVSALASLFLFWLIYFHPPADVTGTQLAFLPALDALLNALAAIALVVGFSFIRARRIGAHRAAMFAAFIFSSAFLAVYITNYALHGEMVFPQDAGAIRWVYSPLLISHIILAVVCLPMILITFFLSLSGRFPTHKKLARWTFPIWLYVSVTGVVVYLMLAAYR